MDKEDLKKYQETVGNIKKLFEWDLELKKVFGPRIDLVKGVFELMQRQMNELAEDKKIEASGEEKSRVKEVVNLFYNIAMNEPIVDIFRDLSVFYLRLVFNWNKELGKRPDIVTAINDTQKITLSQMAMLEAAIQLKYHAKRNRDMMYWQPQSFEVSRHYLESLDKGEE